MAGVPPKLFLFAMFIVAFVAEMCASNATSVEHKVPTSVKDTRPSGVLASLGRMFIDIPLGFVEAFKDGAQLIESLVVTIMRGVFS